MGLFGGLFGGGKDQDAKSRCMECGMSDGKHTEWCPEVHEAQRPVGVGGDAATDAAGEEKARPRG